MPDRPAPLDLARLRRLCDAQKGIPSPVVLVLLDRIDALQALLRESRAGRGRWVGPDATTAAPIHPQGPQKALTRQENR